MNGARPIWLVAACLMAFGVYGQDPPPAEAPPAEAAPPVEAAPPAEAAPPPPPAGPGDIRQVQINVIIGEFGEQGLREVGNNLDYTRFVRDVEQSGSVERVVTNVFNPSRDDFSVTLPVPDTNPFPDNLRPDTSGTLGDGIQAQGGAGLSYSILDSDRGTYEGIMRGIEQTSDLDLHSKPELLVANGKSAHIHAGGDVPYQAIEYAGNGIPYLNVAWQPTGVKVQVTPTLRTDDLIQIFIEDLEVTELSRIENVRGLDLPVFSTRKQSGNVLVPNEKSLVIGGLSSRIIRNNERRVPVLGKIPILGIGFRGRENEAATNTLFIFLTPTLVDLRAAEQQSLDALEFWKGSEWRNRQRIETEIDAMFNNL